MKTVVIEVRSLEQAMDGFEHAWRTGEASEPRHSFASYELLHRVLSPNRLRILSAMGGQGSLAIREVARRIGRDFKGVHSDVTALIKQGLIVKTSDGKIQFPYDTVRFDFELGARTTAA